MVKKGNWYRFNHNGKNRYVSASYLKQLKAASVSGNYEVTGGVNIRSGAGSSHDRVGRLTKGTIITVTGKKGNWYQFNYKGKVRYVSASYLKQTTLAQASGNYEVTGSVNIRSGAGTSYDRVGRLTKGTTITVNGKKGNWYRFDHNGTNRYISGKYLKK